MNKRISINIYCKKEIREEVIFYERNKYRCAPILLHANNLDTARDLLNPSKNIEIINNWKDLSIESPRILYTTIESKYETYLLQTLTVDTFNPNIKYLTLYDDDNGDFKEYKINKISMDLSYRDNVGYSVYIDKTIPCKQEDIKTLNPEIRDLYEDYLLKLEWTHESVISENNRATLWWNKINTQYKELKWFNFVKKKRLLSKCYTSLINGNFYTISIDKRRFKKKEYKPIIFTREIIG